MTPRDAHAAHAARTAAPALSRRHALLGLSALGLGAAALAQEGNAHPATDAAADPTAAAPAAAPPAGLASLGFDAEKGEFVLAPLPYAPEALEPHIDAETMTIHHGAHHAAYVRGVNTALDRLARIRDERDDPSALEHWQRQLGFHLGGHVAHALFWTAMAPHGPGDAAKGGGGEPDAATPLATAIARDFGSFSAFAGHFKQAAARVEGSGWAFLVREPVSGRLLIQQMHNQQNGLTAGVAPLLGIDVWEHAYYLRHRNKRADYIEAFMHVINWPEVARRFIAAGA
jgi:Fe-Mn family superoxide dismutase